MSNVIFDLALFRPSHQQNWYDWRRMSDRTTTTKIVIFSGFLFLFVFLQYLMWSIDSIKRNGSRMELIRQFFFSPSRVELILLRLSVFTYEAFNFFPFLFAEAWWSPGARARTLFSVLCASLIWMLSPQMNIMRTPEFRNHHGASINANRSLSMLKHVRARTHMRLGKKSQFKCFYFT